MIVETLLPALLPALGDGIRGLFNKFTGNAGSKPANVDEVIKLNNSNIDRLKALAELDKVSANVSPWVANIRALQRPFYGALILGGYVFALATNADTQVTLQLGTYAQMVTFYIFGDVVYGQVRAS